MEKIRDSKEYIGAEGFMRAIRSKEIYIKSKRVELEALTYRAGGVTGIDYSKDKIQTSPTNFFEMTMADIHDIEMELKKEIEKLEQMKGKAYSFIRQLDSSEQRALLEWYYINGLNMMESGDKMHISERKAYYIRDDALYNIGKLMNF